MNNERDTHFAGFAKLLWDEIEDKIIVVDNSKARHYHPLASEVSSEITLLIARRAYDLVYHTFAHTSPSNVADIWYGAPADVFQADLQEAISKIPDLTEWPPPSNVTRGE